MKYRALYIVAKVFQLLGWFNVVIGVWFMIGWFRSFGKIPTNDPLGFTFISMLGTFVWIPILLVGIFLIAHGELFHVLMDIEFNTRQQIVHKPQQIPE